MPLFLGVDAGGTTTTYVLADENRELARVESGSTKRMRVSAEIAEANLSEACTKLARISGLNLRQVTRTCIGAAGFSVPLVAGWLRQAFASHVGGSLELVGDVEIALDAAFPGGRGVLVLAGTGSNVAARTADGRLTGAGGWGPAVADEGSGFSIGRSAVRAVFDAVDAEVHTVLQRSILDFWNVDFPDLVSLVNAAPPPDFAKLVPLVLQAAVQRDTVAQRVLRRAGEALADTALLAIARLRRMEGEGYSRPSVALAGGILRFVPPVREALTARLRQILPDLPVANDVVDPVLGALWRARFQPADDSQATVLH